MAQKLALKKLTASDLTFFEWHYRNHPAGKQKAINLNANIFIQKLYPNLPGVAERKSGRIPVNLYLFGPGLQEGYNLQRKIIKATDTYKNWRLNGELIYNPEDKPDRFNVLQPEDFVIFEFIGDIEPDSAKVLFIATNQAEDSAIHAWLKNFIGNGSMVTLTMNDLQRLVSEVTIPNEHPINNFLLEDYLQDAALGGIEGIKKLRTSPYKGRISQEALERARENATLTGKVGEEIVNIYFEKQLEAQLIKEYSWISKENAISPFDFSITSVNDETRRIDVKSTKNGFESLIHISYNELLCMGLESTRYDIYRVFDIDEKTAKLRIARNLKDFAKQIITVFEKLPQGVKPDNISVAPSMLNFEADITIEIPEDFYSE